MEQPDGSYPRINGELMSTGAYDDMIVSMIGKFDTTRTDVTAAVLYTHFICCDNQVIELVTEHAAALPPEVMTVANEMVFELIGQVQSQSTKLVVFVIRPLSIDMDLHVYNNMLVKVLHNPKYMNDYFPSSAGNGSTTATSMITG